MFTCRALCEYPLFFLRLSSSHSCTTIIVNSFLAPRARRDLSQDAAVDDRTQRLCAVPAVDIFIAGFVCKSVSMQNARRGEAKDCIREASGLTGVTFQGIVEYVKAKRPPVVILENVRGLTVGNLERPPVIRDVERVFHQNDYAFAWRILNTWDFLLPQRRNRCWMWAFRGRRNQSAAERAGDIISGLGQEQKFWKMADLFHQVQARPAQPSKKKLTVRERDVVKEVRKQVPRNFRSGLVVDVGQSVGRGHFCVNGASPCLLPNSKIQLAFKAGKSIKRRILGIEELMALQGLFREDFPALPAWATERRVLSRDLLGNAFTTTVLMAVSVGVCAEGPLRGSATRAGA